jgi:hypothetical protein
MPKRKRQERLHQLQRNLLFGLAGCSVRNSWSVLITAFATIAMGYFTFTLKESTDKLWIAGEKQFTHVKKQASQAFLDRGADLNRLHDQMRIAQQSADAAKRTAEAAAQQAKVTEAALTQLERPYIFIFGVRGIR